MRPNKLYITGRSGTQKDTNWEEVMQGKKPHATNNSTILENYCNHKILQLNLNKSIRICTQVDI